MYCIPILKDQNHFLDVDIANNDENNDLISECESLVRKMLVRDPSKRYTLKMVRKHTWMRADIKAAESAKNYTKPTLRPPTVINEQILRVMQSLGIGV